MLQAEHALRLAGRGHKGMRTVSISLPSLVGSHAIGAGPDIEYLVDG